MQQSLPDNKRWRFQTDAMQKFEDEDHFLDRQLNETRYLSRTARTYLERLYDGKTESGQRVRVIPGRMTALLRRGWGLEGMLRVAETGEIARKQRDDHRHHAIDAFVVANTTQGLLQRFARASQAPTTIRREADGDRGRRPPLGRVRPKPVEALPRPHGRVVQTRPQYAWRGKHQRTAPQRDSIRTGRVGGDWPVQGRSPQEIVRLQETGGLRLRSRLDVT